jgi:hypothetical protein
MNLNHFLSKIEKIRMISSFDRTGSDLQGWELEI